MDAQQLERLVDEYGPQVYRFCLRLTLYKPDAEDLYQQVFLYILERNLKIRGDGNPRSFLFSVACGIWRNEQRKRVRRSTEPSGTLDLEAARDNIEEEVLAQLESEEVKRIVSRLPSKYRVPLILQYTFQMSLKEIGAVEHVPVGTVKSRLYQAKAIVKKEMEEKGYGKTY